MGALVVGGHAVGRQVGGALVGGGVEREQVVELAGEEVVRVEHGAREGPDSGSGSAEDAVPRELVGDAVDGYGSVELHDAAVGGDHLHHRAAVLVWVAVAEAFEHAVSHSGFRGVLEWIWIWMKVKGFN